MDLTKMFNKNSKRVAKIYNRKVAYFNNTKQKINLIKA